MASKGMKIGLIILGIVVILIIAVIILLWQVGFFATPTMTVEQRGPYHYVYVERTGPFSEIPMGYQQVDSLVKKQDIEVGIACGAYLDNPSQVAQSDLRWRAGYIVKDSVQTSNPLKFMTINQHLYLVAAIDAIPMVAAIKTYPEIQKWLKDNPYTASGPAYELYNDNGIVEVIFPVEKAAE